MNGRWLESRLFKDLAWNFLGTGLPLLVAVVAIPQLISAIGPARFGRRKAKVRTFGKVEMERRLKRYFRDVRFYYPYPDSKLPDCVLSARNGMLEHFANSFLVFVGRNGFKGASFEQLAILYSGGRTSKFATRTRIISGPDRWVVSTQSLQSAGSADGGAITLIDIETPWLNTQSRSQCNDLSLEEIFAPCRPWVHLLVANSRIRNGVKYLDGAHVDSIWRNVYPYHAGLNIIDRVWWHAEIPMNVIVIRAIYDFLLRLDRVPPISAALNIRSGRVLLRRIATAIGAYIARRDFEAFIALESELQAVVCGRDKASQRAFSRWFLIDIPSLRQFRRSMKKAQSIIARARARLE